MTRRSEFQSPAISLVQQPSRAVGVVVVGLASSGTDAKPVLLGVPAGLRKTYTKQFSADVVDLADDLGASAEIGTVVTLPSTSEGRLVVVGLGEVDVTPDQVRTAAAEGVRAVDRNDKLSGPVAVSFEITDPELVQAATEGALLGPYRVDTLAAEERPAGPAIEIVSSNTKAEAKDALERGRVVATAVAIARDWVNLPPNLLFPASFAEGATTVLKDAKVAVEYDGDQHRTDRRQWREDRERDAALRAEGWEVIRVTADVFRPGHWELFVRQLRGLVAARTMPGRVPPSWI